MSIFSGQKAFGFARKRSSAPVNRGSEWRSRGSFPSRSLPAPIVLTSTHHERLRGLLRVVGAFFATLTDRSPYEQVSLGREFAFVMTYSGPLAYRWDRCPKPKVLPRNRKKNV